MIKKANELDFSNKKFVIIIAGVPGIGKSTLGLSAPRPLLIDLDNGIDRVEAPYRKDTLLASTYQELKDDLTNSDLSSYDTFVIDTGGKLFELIKPYVINEDIKNAKKNGDLSLQGYGASGREFSKFTQFLKSFNKHIVYIFHASEVNLDDDLTGLRIRIEGSSKDKVWDDADIGGFIEMRGNQRTITFSNTPRFYAKGTHGIHGTYDIPTLKNGTSNTFLTDLINKMKSDLNNEVKDYKEFIVLKNKYRSKLEMANNVKSINELFNLYLKENHILSSKIEIGNMINNKAKELNLTYDKEKKEYVERT